MIYEYKCRDCEKITEKEYSIQEHPSSVGCEYCGHDAPRYLGSVSIHIPYSFRSVPAYTPEVMDPVRETQEACRQMNVNSQDYI